MQPKAADHYIRAIISDVDKADVQDNSIIMPEMLKIIVAAAFVAWFGWQFRHWFAGSWSFRRGILFRVAGALLGALTPMPIEVGLPVGYIVGVAASLAYNSIYE